jgi:hypothetical protein
VRGYVPEGRSSRSHARDVSEVRVCIQGGLYDWVDHLTLLP